MRIFREEISPAVARRMSASLETILRWTKDSQWPGVAWSFSHLTGDGFPVEFTFSLEDAAVRYTAEVAGAEVAEADRLPRALSLIESLGGHSPSNQIRALLRRIQTPAAPLSYGAWIGGRHGASGDRYKLYAEVPQAARLRAASLLGGILGEGPLLESRATQFRMIGCEPVQQRVEFYFQVAELETWELARLLGRAHLSSRQTDLLTLLEELNGRSAQSKIPGANLGFSYSFALDGGPLVFSLFTYARSIFGSDMSIRRNLLKLGKNRGWNLRTYEKLSEPLIHRTGPKTRHGLLAFIVPPAGSLSLHIGIRPPESPPDLEE
jgi:hypothetical protein